MRRWIDRKARENVVVCLAKAALIAALLAFVPVARASWEDMDAGIPYGKMSVKDVDRFLELSRSRGVDMRADMDKAYGGDAQALERIFGLSTTFQKMDKMARVYGNFLFSMFLDMGERRGEKFFGKAIAEQPASVQQRVRDFLYHAVLQVPRSERVRMENQARSDFPSVFPAEYLFSRQDPLFK
jgi:hypothetical protein